MATESSLNEAQRRRVFSNARHADKLLSEIEGILGAADSKSVFPRYVADLAPAQIALIRDSIARFRTQLSRAMDGLGIVPELPALGSLHSVRVTLAFIRIAIEEMAPHYLRGYGEIAPGAASQLQGLCVELEGLLERLSSALADAPAADMEARLERLPDAGNVALLRRIERTIAARGLVELRPRLAAIVERLESNRFEIAIFGRVSSGKSSLLNRILETTALPVGVNPITAVPTRLIHGDAAALTASFADRKVERLPIERLPELVSEVYNPANAKGVARLVVELPSARLATGLAFVDTPGLGSLATAGAAETLAYLPQCDLGVVLVAGGSPLNEEDLSTILRLREAAIPVKVLLSKADLLSPADLESALQYTSQQLGMRLGALVPVHAVSAEASHADLLERWFLEEIEPLYARHRELAEESSHRKTQKLRAAAEAALGAKLKGNETTAPAREKLVTLERELREAAGKLEQAREFCLRVSGEVRGWTPDALDAAAGALLGLWMGADGAGAKAAIAGAILKTASASARIHAYLRELAVALAEALQRTSEALDSDDVPAAEELLRAVHEMPRFDLPRLSGNFGRPRLLGPRTLARRRAYARVSSDLEEPLTQAFATHARLIEEWSRGVLAQLQLKFDGAADAYRAQISRRLSGADLPAEERHAIVTDLAGLQEGQAG